MKYFIALLICVLHISHAAASTDSHPVTGCYWQWMNGNISKEGITRDLEYMKKAGIESAFIFNLGVGVKRGRVDYGSKEWTDCVKHACKEARRLGITLGLHNSPGYSAMGGAWIRPEESMKELTWSVSSKKMPPIPFHKSDFYRDIKVFHTTCDDEMQAINRRLEKGESLVVTLNRAKPLTGLNLWRGQRERPVDEFDGPRDYSPRLTVEVSTDRKNWKLIGTMAGVPLKARDIPMHFSCPATQCRYVRLTTNRGTNLNRIEILTAPGSGTTYRRVGYTTTGETVTASCDSGIGLEVDKLSRKGVEAHFKRSLKPLLDELKDYCGNTLKYIVIDSWEAGGQDWTESLGADYITTGEGKDFLDGGTGRVTPTKQRLFMTEFVLPFKEMLKPYGLVLTGEPYGNGDFDRKEYGMALDLPMSEYWARCHYGSIDRPYFVSRYGHSAGREVIGCESFTAYPGDADIAPTLGSFKKDVDKLCEAGVNFFVLHCVTHQDDDSLPLTMGPFGTRFDRLHANADSVRALTDYMRYRVEQQKHKITFDYYTKDESQRAYLRLPFGSRIVKELLLCDVAARNDSAFSNREFLHGLDWRGAALAFVPNDILGDSVRLKGLIVDFAKNTEHEEIAAVPRRAVSASSPEIQKKKSHKD